MVAHLAFGLHLLLPNQIQLEEESRMPMKKEFVRLAGFTVLAYATVQSVSPAFFNHVVSLIASAVWGN
jgi:hypothetical protein